MSNPGSPKEVPNCREKHPVSRANNGNNEKVIIAR